MEHFQFWNIFSPQIHDCLNNIEIRVFITFKIIPWTLFSLYYVFFNVFFDAGKLQIIQFCRSLFLYLLSFWFQRHQQKTPDITTFVLSFFPFCIYLSSHVSLLLQLLTCLLFRFLFRYSKLQIVLWIIFFSFFFTFSSEPTVTTADTTPGLLFLNFIFRCSKLQITKFFLSCCLSFSL